LSEAHIGAIEFFEALEQPEGAVFFAAAFERSIFEATLGAVAFVGAKTAFGDECPKLGRAPVDELCA
jgi:hypothetical protein